MIYLYDYKPGIILCMHPANERQRYNVKSSLIGWAHTQNDPCKLRMINSLPVFLYYKITEQGKFMFNNSHPSP